MNLDGFDLKWELVKWRNGSGPVWVPGGYSGQNCINDLFLFKKERILISWLPKGKILCKVLL